MKLFVVLPFLVAVVSVSFKSIDQSEDWKVPEASVKMKNPVEADSESISIGKSLYTKHCKSCHGTEGLGDGTKAEELDTFPGDFSTKEFQAQTDGALFYKLTEGRDEMPEFTKKIPEEEDRWMIVNYLRTMAE